MQTEANNKENIWWSNSFLQQQHQQQQHDDLPLIFPNGFVWIFIVVIKGNYEMLVVCLRHGPPHRFVVMYLYTMRTVYYYGIVMARRWLITFFGGRKYVTKWWSLCNSIFNFECLNNLSQECDNAWCVCICVSVSVYTLYYCILYTVYRLICSKCPHPHFRSRAYHNLHPRSLAPFPVYEFEFKSRLTIPTFLTYN